MKAFLAAVLLTLVSSTFAATCFEAVSRPYAFIPKEICFEKIEVDSGSHLIFISNSEVLPPHLKATDLYRKNEDYFRFRTSYVVAEESESCGYGHYAVLNITGLSDNWGQVESQNLEMTVDYERTNDNCHSIPQEGKVVYELKK